MMEDSNVKLETCCKHLRHKMMYCDARHAPRGQVDDSSDTRVFFCVKTGDALGPDSRTTCPSECQASRQCYQAASRTKLEAL
jgi:hypothetical protein